MIGYRPVIDGATHADTGSGRSQGGFTVARRRRRNQTGTYLTFTILAAAVALSWWWLYTWSRPVAGNNPALALGPKPPLTTDRPEIVPVENTVRDVPEKGAGGEPGDDNRKSNGANVLNVERAGSLIEAGKQASAKQDPVAARSHFSEALALIGDTADAKFLRAELTRLSAETIFSPRIIPNDPLVDRYVIQPGDTLARIASRNKISSDLLADMNGIKNKNLIRAGQTIKLVRGPFRAVVSTKGFRLDVYLGTVFVRQYPVGLGIDGSTPVGEWRVRTKLRNPTYYPPRGGDIVSADDPQNPLGERWIAIEGVSGEAVGQQRYGIHGTIEPESIGKEASLGCIRLFNEDVEELYTYLVEKHSTVTIR